MTQQKIPLFGGLPKACQDGTAASGGLLTSIFTPPDSSLAAGSQSYYAVHLWMRPTSHYTNPDPMDPTVMGASFAVAAYRASAPADKRLVWAGNSYSLNQPAAPTMLPFVSPGIRCDYGVGVKVLDGYLVRGDVLLELAIQNATLNAYTSADPLVQPTGTFIWGYYQRVGTDDSWRTIGEPPVGPKFDTGLPIILLPGERKIIHTFEANRFDELAIQMVNPNPLSTAVGAVLLSFADASQVNLPHTTSLFLNAQAVTGSPNSLRDPEMVYGFTGVFGGNPQLRYLMAENEATIYAVQNAYIHGRFNRH